MGCLKLTYDYQEQGEKNYSLQWQVWVNPDTDFLEVGNQQTNGNGPDQSVVTQQDLIDFVSQNPFYSQYPAEWILDSQGLRTSERNPGKTIPTIVRRNGELSVTSLKVYIHPSAFGVTTDFRQTLITGHEFIHVMHLSSGSYLRWINAYSESGAEAISEYWSYKWQVENENRLGYPIGGQAGLNRWTGLLPAGYTPR